MRPYYEDDAVTLHHGDCLDVLRSLPDASVDAVVTDPPYGIRFMGQAWDGADIVATQLRGKETSPMPPGVGGPNGGYRSLAAEAGRYDQSLSANQTFQAWVEEWARECLRVLKPGGHLLASGSPRTGHRLAAGIEDAGFEIRDSIAWLYGSGFPKSMDVSKAIDKAAGAEREVVGRYVPPNGKAWNLTADVARAEVGAVGHTSRADSLDLTAPATPDAERWQGWGTALKPAFEPIVVARKPLVGTVAANVLAHGTGALNIDGGRVAASGCPLIESKSEASVSTFGDGLNGSRNAGATDLGRWPANVILDESQAVVLDAQSGDRKAGGNLAGTEPSRPAKDCYGEYKERREWESYADTGGASRFFYVAKADASERVRVNGIAHPTVKPLALMRWLVRLVTPPGGTVLEPFAGSGTTVEACILEGFRCIAVEREADYLPLIVQRINRRRDPVAAVKATGDDGGLFDLLGEGT